MPRVIDNKAANDKSMKGVAKYEDGKSIQRVPAIEKEPEPEDELKQIMRNIGNAIAQIPAQQERMVKAVEQIADKPLPNYEKSAVHKNQILNFTIFVTERDKNGRIKSANVKVGPVESNKLQ